MQQIKRPSTFSSKTPPMMERQKQGTTEVSRYDHLKKAAGTYFGGQLSRINVVRLLEQLMKSQVSNKTEISSLVRRSVPLCSYISPGNETPTTREHNRLAEFYGREVTRGEN